MWDFSHLCATLCWPEYGVAFRGLMFHAGHEVVAEESGTERKGTAATTEGWGEGLPQTEAEQELEAGKVSCPRGPGHPDG